MAEYLPPIVQRFIADAAGYNKSVDGMMAKVREWKRTVEESDLKAREAQVAYNKAQRDAIRLSEEAALKAKKAETAALAFANTKSKNARTLAMLEGKAAKTAREAEIADAEAADAREMAAIKAARAEEAGSRRTTFAHQALKNSYRGLAQAGKVAWLGVGGGALIAGYESAKAATAYQANMELLRTQSGASQKTVDELTKSVLKLSPATEFGPNELAKSLYHIVSVGKLANQPMYVLKAAADGAANGMANMEETTNALVSLMKTGIPGGSKDARKAMADIDAIVGAGNMRMDEFNNTLKTGFFDAASTFGVSLRSAGAALAYLTDRVPNAQIVATRLRMSLSLLAAPAQKATDALKAMHVPMPEIKSRIAGVTEALKEAHITTTQMAYDLKKPDGILVALQDLKRHFQAAGLNQTQQATVLSRVFGGGRSGSAIMALYNNLDQLDQKYKQISHTSQRFENNLKATKETANYTFKQAKAAVETFAIELGTHLMHAGQKAIVMIVEMAKWLQKHRDIAIALAVAIGGPLVAALTAAAIETAVMLAPWVAAGAILGGATLAVIELYKHCRVFRQVVNDVFSFVHHMWTQLVGWWKSNSKTIIQDVKAMWLVIKTTFEITFQIVLMIVRTSWGFIKAEWNIYFHFILDLTKTMFNIIHAVFKTAFTVIIDVVKIFIDLFKGHWSRLGSDFKNLVTDTLKGVVSIFEAILGGLVNIVFDLGKNIVQGLINGIKSMGGAIAGAAKGIAGSVEGAFKSALHIFSPSRVFAGHGANIVKGLANGLKENAHHAAKASEHVAHTTAVAYRKKMNEKMKEERAEEKKVHKEYEKFKHEETAADKAADPKAFHAAAKASADAIKRAKSDVKDAKKVLEELLKSPYATAAEIERAKARLKDAEKNEADLEKTAHATFKPRRKGSRGSGGAGGSGGDNSSLNDPYPDNTGNYDSIGGIDSGPGSIDVGGSTGSGTTNNYNSTTNNYTANVYPITEASAAEIAKDVAWALKGL